jgi:hypothetical protein
MLQALLVVALFQPVSEKEVTAQLRLAAPPSNFNKVRGQILASAVKKGSTPLVIGKLLGRWTGTHHVESTGSEKRIWREYIELYDVIGVRVV